jgi:hypothetical protein
MSDDDALKSGVAAQGVADPAGEAHVVFVQLVGWEGKWRIATFSG